VFSNKEIILNGKDITGLDGFIQVKIKNWCLPSFFLRLANAQTCYSD
jgi:hypothetical protein